MELPQCTRDQAVFKSKDSSLLIRSLQEEWILIWTTNIIERLNEEFKRRTQPMGIVTGEASCCRLLGFISWFKKNHAKLLTVTDPYTHYTGTKSGGWVDCRRFGEVPERLSFVDRFPGGAYEGSLLQMVSIDPYCFRVRIRRLWDDSNHAVIEQCRNSENLQRYTARFSFRPRE